MIRLLKKRKDQLSLNCGRTHVTGSWLSEAENNLIYESSGVFSSEMMEGLDHIYCDIKCWKYKDQECRTAHHSTEQKHCRM